MHIEVKDKNWCVVGPTNGYILHGNKIEMWIQLCLIVQNVAERYKGSARLVDDSNKVIYKYSYSNKK